MAILFPKPLEVNESDGFANDILDRKEYGELILNLVINTHNPLVISLDGKWGEGKTTFIKMWQGLLNQSAVPNIYIDAFANDHVDDAFISIVSAITHYAEDKIPEENFKDLKEKAKKVGAKFLSWSVRMGAKAATLGIIKNEDINLLMDIQKDLSKSVSDSLGDIIDERISSHAKDIQSVESFKEFLSKLPAQLEKNEESKPLVIIIDELDRCKPNFAIEILEKIKHLFSVPNIVFLLVINSDQLEESIKSVYGQKIDAHAYLQKFISVELKLPKKVENYESNDIRSYASKLINSSRIKIIEDNSYILLNLVSTIGNHFNLSLRDLEKVFTILSYYYDNFKEFPAPISIVSFLAIVKVKNKHVFERLIYQNITYGELYKELKMPIKNMNNHDEPKFLIEDLDKYLKWTLFSQDEMSSSKDDFSKWNGNGSRADYTRKKIIPKISQRLSMFVVR